MIDDKEGVVVELARNLLQAMATVETQDCLWRGVQPLARAEQMAGINRNDTVETVRVLGAMLDELARRNRGVELGDWPTAATEPFRVEHGAVAYTEPVIDWDALGEPVLPSRPDYEGAYGDFIDAGRGIPEPADGWWMQGNPNPGVGPAHRIRHRLDGACAVEPKCLYEAHGQTWRPRRMAPCIIPSITPGTTADTGYHKDEHWEDKTCASEPVCHPAVVMSTPVRRMAPNLKMPNGPHTVEHDEDIIDGAHHPGVCARSPACVPLTGQTPPATSARRTMRLYVGWLREERAGKHERFHRDIGFPEGFDITRYTRNLPDILVGSPHYEERREEKGLPQMVSEAWVKRAELIDITRVDGRLVRYAVRGDWSETHDLTLTIEASTGRLITGWFNRREDWHRLTNTKYDQP